MSHFLAVSLLLFKGFKTHSVHIHDTNSYTSSWQKSATMRALKTVTTVCLFALLQIVSSEEEKNFYFNKFLTVSLRDIGPFLWGH